MPSSTPGRRASHPGEAQLTYQRFLTLEGTRGLARSSFLLPHSTARRLLAVQTPRSITTFQPKTRSDPRIQGLREPRDKLVVECHDDVSRFLRRECRGDDGRYGRLITTSLPSSVERVETTQSPATLPTGRYCPKKHVELLSCNPP